MSAAGSGAAGSGAVSVCSTSAAVFVEASASGASAVGVAGALALSVAVGCASADCDFSSGFASVASVVAGSTLIKRLEIFAVSRNSLRIEARRASLSANFSAIKSPTPLITSSTEFKPLSTRTNSVARVARSESVVFDSRISSANGNKPCWRATAALDCFLVLKGKYKSSSRRLEVVFSICTRISSVSPFWDSMARRIVALRSDSTRSVAAFCLTASSWFSFNPPVWSLRNRVTKGIVFPASNKAKAASTF